MRKILFTVLGLAAAITMSAQKYESQRPAESERLFKSEAIELKIAEITQKLANPVESPRIFGPIKLPSSCCKNRIKSK